MNTPRAIAIVFNGGEVSEKTLQKIQKLLSSDDSSNANSVRIATFDTVDLAELVTEHAFAGVVANEAIHDDDDIMELYPLHASDTIMQIDTLKHFVEFLSSFYGRKGKTVKVNFLQLVRDYLKDERVHIAFKELAKYTDDELTKNPSFAKSGISMEFVKHVRDIVENVPR